MPREPLGNPVYNNTGFNRFMDRLIMHGLEYMGLYYASYRAEVTRNDDPDNPGQPDPQGRLHVRVPAVGDTQRVERLAYPIVPFAGNGFCAKFIPAVGTYVYVEFENGKLDIPLWKGGWWAQNDMPSDFTALETYGFQTPGGHKIILDEQSGQEFIRVEHSNGAKIELDSNGSIFVTNTTGQKVNVGAGADSANEPALLGTTLKGLLEQLIDGLTALTVPTGVGPSGTPVNAAQFIAVKAQLQRALSNTVNVK